MVTVRSGSADNVTSTVTAAPPSVAVYDAALNCTVTAGSSLSARLTVVVSGLVAVTPVGSVPKPIVMLSSSSSTMSSTASTVKEADSSPALKVTDVSDSV